MLRIRGLICVTVYLLAFLSALTFFTVKLFTYKFAEEEFKLILVCFFVGGLGGVLYCLRGVYLNFCVRSNWSDRWIPWYLIRPVVSTICGGVSYIFLKAGLLILESNKEPDATNLGFYALSFISGMNVDKFIAKVEDLAKATWGIEKSRASQSEGD